MPRLYLLSNDLHQQKSYFLNLVPLFFYHQRGKCDQHPAKPGFSSLQSQKVHNSKEGHDCR